MHSALIEESLKDLVGNLSTTRVLFICFLSVIVFFLGKYYWDRRWLYYYASKIHGPRAYPIIGNGFYFLGGTETILENTMSIFREFPSPARIWLGNRLFFNISDPKDLEIIMNQALWKEKLYDFTQPLVGTGLFTAPVDKWRRHRKVILPTFNPNILNTFVEIFAEHSRILVGKLEDKVGTGYFDIFPILSRCTLDIICETALGQKVNAQSSNVSYVKWVGIAMEIFYVRMFQLWYHPDWIWRLTPLSRKLTNVCDNANNFLRAIISERKEEYRKAKKLDCRLEDTKRKAFLDYLIELSEEGAHWSDEEIMEEASTITIAGSDSTGSMDSFALIMLGMHPEIQAKVVEELQGIFGDSDRDVTAKDLPKMVFLERVIKETLRLFPVGPLIVRALHEDLKLDSYTLPKGSSCVLGILHTHRDPNLWPDPLRFDPDRFLPEEVAKRHPYSYVPFSAGPRNCIGPRYAMMAMKGVISTIVRNYKISTDYKSVAEIRVKADLMIKCVDGYRVSLEHRPK